MIKRNTRNFWNRKLIEIEEINKLLKSPIYADKNKTVVNYLYNIKGKLLNVGFGYGMLEQLLMEEGSKINFYGIDISNKAIKLIRNNVKGNFVVANVKSIPFKRDFFDAVVALDVLEHLTKEELSYAILEIKRVMKLNGLFIVSVPLNESSNDRKLNRHQIIFTKQDLIKLLINQGFEIKKTKIMFAFGNNYVIKSLIARTFKLRKPNLLMVFCIKK